MKSLNDMNLSNRKITNVANPVDNQDVVTKAFQEANTAAKTHSHAFSELTAKPTTLSGYGITDAANSTHTHTFSSLTSKPTTLSGYGITDAASSSHTHTFASLTGKPTTLSGYGITDAAANSHTHTGTQVSYSAIAGFPTSPNASPTDVQKAIDNLFTYANSGKAQIANAIGGQAQATDTFATLAGYIANMGNKTYGVTKSVTFDETISKDDPIESYYRSLAPLKLANPTAPTGALSSAGAVAFSDNNYIALGTNVSPFIALYSQSGDTITKLTDIASGLPTGAVNGIAFSKEATYLAAAHTGGTFLKIFKRRGDVFDSTGITISASPTAAGRSCAFSNDSQFLAVGHTLSTTQSLTVYQRSVDTFTKLTISDQPPDDVYGVSWSSDGTYLACAHWTSPYVTMYKRSGTTFTKLTVSGGNPTGNPYGVSFSPDDTYVAIAHATTPFVTVYKRNGDTFTKIADGNFSVSPGATCRSIAWSPNGVYLGVGIGAGNFQIVYKCINDTFTKQTDPATFPTGTANGFAWSYDAEYYAVAHTTSPFISMYKNNSSTYLFRKINPAGTASISRFDKIIGLAQEAGTAGLSKNASILTGGGLLP